MEKSKQIKAMANESRLMILKLLAKPQRHFGHQQSADCVVIGVCMSLIADALGISQPSVSRHLDILKQAGFIRVRKQQKWSYCKRDEAAIQGYLDWLSQELNLHPSDGSAA